MKYIITRVGGVLVAFLLANLLAIIEAQDAPAAVKEERILAALMDFVDVDPAERLFSKADLENLLVRDDDSVRNFMWETSRHTLQIDFDILDDWVTVNRNREDLTRGTVVEEAISELSYFADLHLYDRVILFIWPIQGGYPGCAAELGPRRYYTPNGVFDLTVASLLSNDEDCMDKGSVAHELGHTYGLLQSLMFLCDKDPPLPASLVDVGDLNDSCWYHGCTNDDSCTDTKPVGSTSVYGQTGELDIMASEWGYETHYPLHFKAIWQRLAGWLPESQVVTAESSGTYRVTTLERLDSQPKAMRIALGRDQLGDPVNYWFETREFNPWSTVRNIYEPPRPGVFTCQVDVRLESSGVVDEDSYGSVDYCELERSRGYGATFMFQHSSWKYSDVQVGPTPLQETIIRRNAPFHDPYRGVFAVVSQELLQ